MIYFLIIAFILAIRIYLLKKASLTAVDQWYWLKYKEAVKSQKRIPAELKEYILEVKQWYPPFFGWFLSKVDFNTILITQILSFLRLLIIVAFGLYLGVDSFILFLGVVVYLTAPILVYYDNQINSRIFGALILDLVIISYYFYFLGNSYFLIPIFLLTLLLLFTHKMTHQLYIFLILGMSVFYKDFIPILIYLLATFFAFSFGYKNYLKAHIEIVKFWHRNRYKLGAHQFYESSLYGKKNFVYKNRIHGNSLKLWIKKIALIIGLFPFMIFLVFNLKFNFFGLIVFLTILFIFLTMFLPFLYCIGMGTLYAYNLVSFSAFYLFSIQIEFSLFNEILLGVVFSLTFFSIFKFYKGLLEKEKVKDDNLEEALNFLKNSNIDRVLVIPFQLPDEVAYKTNKKVFWGGHGYGFLWLEPYFPVFNEKVEKAISDWNLGGVFLQKFYWPEFFKEVDMTFFNKEFENEKYIILSVKNWKNRDKIPTWALKKYKDIFDV